MKKLPKQTYNHFYSQTYINNVREIHSTDINIFRNVKSTIPTILTCTLNQGCPIHWHPWAKNLKHFDQTKDFTCISIRHLAWILFDSSFILESDLAMSSSGKWRQTNTNHHQQQKNNHKTQTHNESTNMLMCNLCLMHVRHIHFHYQELILPVYNSTPWCELLLGCTNATSRPLSRSAFPLSFSAEHRDLKWRQRIHAE